MYRVIFFNSQFTSKPIGHSIRQLCAAHSRGLSQSTASLELPLVPATSTPIASTHQQLLSSGSHCILSNSPVVLLHFGMNCDGPRGPRARDLLTAACANCSHPVSSPGTHLEPQDVLQQRSPGDWHWKSFSQAGDLDGQTFCSSKDGHRPTVLSDGSENQRRHELQRTVSEFTIHLFRKAFTPVRFDEIFLTCFATGFN